MKVSSGLVTKSWRRRWHLSLVMSEEHGRPCTIEAVQGSGSPGNHLCLLDDPWTKPELKVKLFSLAILKLHHHAWLSSPGSLRYLFPFASKFTCTWQRRRIALYFRWFVRWAWARHVLPLPRANTSFSHYVCSASLPNSDSCCPTSSSWLGRSTCPCRSSFSPLFFKSEARIFRIQVPHVTGMVDSAGEGSAVVYSYEGIGAVDPGQISGTRMWFAVIPSERHMYDASCVAAEIGSEFCAGRQQQYSTAWFCCWMPPPHAAVTTSFDLGAYYFFVRQRGPCLRCSG